MKRIFSTACFFSLALVTTFAALTFSGTALPPIPDTPDKSTGLDEIYVIDNTNGVTATYTAASPSATVNWFRFNALGGGFAEPVASTRDGRLSSVKLTSDDMGYIVEEGTTRKYYWIVNYANHPCTLRSLSINPESDCSSVVLDFDGNAEKITYYSINGVSKTLSRGLTIGYDNLEFDNDSFSYVQTREEKSLESAQSAIHVASPLCDTEFVLSGDRFLARWGKAEEAASPRFQAVAVAATTKAVQTERNVDNEKEDASAADLGGSAPVEITFSAAVSDAVVYREWQFSYDPDFADIDMRVNETETTRTFLDFGTIYARFLAGNDAGTCDYISDTYTISIGESRLDCPNAFSPGTSEGTNDEWKVSYKSIISFDCHIFNRWGIEMAHLTAPSQGWDGRYGGKYVPAGVYYYVISAEGSDGKRYKLSGDINIIKMSESSGSYPSGSE